MFGQIQAVCINTIHFAASDAEFRETIAYGSPCEILANQITVSIE